ncbi:MAG: hypothetical protein ABIC95_03905 [archaeon]
MVSGSIDQEKIQSEAKAIMDEFLKAIESLEYKEGDGLLRRKRQVRERNDKGSTLEDNEFRQRFLSNAPSHDTVYLLAEKKKW